MFYLKQWVILNSCIITCLVEIYNKFIALNHKYVTSTIFNQFNHIIKFTAKVIFHYAHQLIDLLFNLATNVKITISKSPFTSCGRISEIQVRSSAWELYWQSPLDCWGWEELERSPEKIIQIDEGWRKRHHKHHLDPEQNYLYLLSLILTTKTKMINI